MALMSLEEEGSGVSSDQSLLLKGWDSEYYEHERGALGVDETLSDDFNFNPYAGVYEDETAGHRPSVVSATFKMDGSKDDGGGSGGGGGAPLRLRRRSSVALPFPAHPIRAREVSSRWGSRSLPCPHRETGNCLPPTPLLIHTPHVHPSHQVFSSPRQELQNRDCLAILFKLLPSLAQPLQNRACSDLLKLIKLSTNNIFILLRANSWQVQRSVE